MLLIRTTKIYWNEKKTEKRTSNCKKRNLVLRGEKDVKDRTGGAFPFGIIASAAAPLVGEVVKPIFKNIFGGARRRRKRR